MNLLYNSDFPGLSLPRTSAHSDRFSVKVKKSDKLKNLEKSQNLKKTEASQS